MTTAPSAAPAGGPEPDGEAGPEGAAGPGVRRRRSARHTFAATTLVLEGFVVFFATLVAFGLRVAPPSVVWAVGGVLAVVLVLLSGMLSRPGGYLAGTVVQGFVLAGGLVLYAAPVDGAAFVASMTLAVGAVFVTLWIVALRLGGRIDRERSEWDAAHPDG